MQDCDTLLMIGSSMPYSQFLPELGQARAVQIDIDPHNIGLRYTFNVHLVGDAKETLTRLLPKLHAKDDRSWRRKIEAGIEDWWQVVVARAMNVADPVNPQRVYWELSPRLPDDCIISADSGSSTNWFARDLKIREGMRASLSGTLATMGPAVPERPLCCTQAPRWWERTEWRRGPSRLPQCNVVGAGSRSPERKGPRQVRRRRG